MGEALPAEDNSMDAVVGTLVMCSVSDVEMALRGKSCFFSNNSISYLSTNALYNFCKALQHMESLDMSMRQDV